MSQTYRVWYLLVPLVALLPAGARLLWWQRSARHADVDAAMAKAGETLFVHEWKPKDPLCPDGDGLGPVFNAKSCVACHHKGGTGGSGDLRFNVTTFTVRQGGLSREGVVHAQHTAGERHRETLQHVNSALPAVSSPSLAQVVVLPNQSNHCLSFPSGVHISQRNTPALFGSKLIDEIPERVILAGAKAQKLKWGLAPADGEDVPVGRASRLADGRVGRFGWKGQIASLSDFVQAACANELGLGNPGQSQPTPIYLASTSGPRKIDLTLKQCDELTAFCASLPKPVERLAKGVSEADAAAGKKLFTTVGCAECHTPKLGDVDGIYSDLLLHRMGQELVGGGSYGEPPAPLPGRPEEEGPSPSEWRTPPLWGVADSAPYLHDGRAATLFDAIKMHGGQGARARDAFAKLSHADQARLVAFLMTLKAPGAPTGEMVATAR